VIFHSGHVPEQEENQMLHMPVIDMVKTGQNIVKLRQKTGLSVRDLQEIFGFATPQAIYKWQHGTALPAIDNLVVLAAVFRVHIDEILVMETAEQIQIGA
jgi:transcriptional regulator with XRE-family HTH domain